MKPALKALLPASASGGLFILLWLVLGVPLPFSVAASGAGYLALWAMLKGLVGKGAEEAKLGDFVDLELARKTTAQGRALAKATRIEVAGLDRAGAYGPKFTRLAELIDAIAVDVEGDPKDALAAAAFLEIHSASVPRLAGLARQLSDRIQSQEQRKEASAKISRALDRLIAAHERQLARLQDDNLAELQAEIEVLEEGLGLAEDLEDASPAKRPFSTSG